MHPSYGVPWPRLEKAAARLKQLNAPNPQLTRIQPYLFLCGLKYLLTYRQVTNRRLTHYLDDGLREAVDLALPALIQASAELEIDEPRGRFKQPQLNLEFQQIAGGFLLLENHLPYSAAHWLARGDRAANLIRLSFGMGVSSRFAAATHDIVRRMVKRPLRMSPPVLDVLESFRWNAEWSLTLAG